MLTDTEKAALVEELARASCNFGVFSWDGETPYMRSEYIRKVEVYLMPIIERLLAERDVDALLDKTPGINALYRTTESVWRCVLADWDQSEGLGATPTAAIAAAVVQDAVKAAKEGKG